MFPPCEVASKSVVPAIKATIAVQLVESHRMTQRDVANLLGLSQSAISKYTTGARGYIVKIDEIAEAKPIITEIVALFTNGKPHKTEVLEKFCKVCFIVRQKGLMCQFCRKAELETETEKCSFCFAAFR